MDNQELFTTDYPLTTPLVKEILAELMEGKDLTTLWITKTGATVLLEKFLQYQNFDVLVGEREKPVFIYLNLDLPYELILKQLSDNLGQYSSAINLNLQLIEIGSRRRIVFVVDNCNFAKQEFLQYLNSLRFTTAQRIAFFLIFVEKDFIRNSEPKPDLQFVYRNVIRIPFFNQKESFAYLERQASSYSLELSPEEKTRAWKYFGGTVALLQYFVINYLKYRDFEKTIHSFEIYNLLQDAWKRYSEREKKVVLAALAGEKLPPYTEEINYLVEHHLLNEDMSVNGSWMKDVASAARGKKFGLKNSKLFWGELDLSQLLPLHDLEFVKQLLKEKSLDREAVARILWGEHFSEKYSEWGIDKFISNLRKDLLNLGITGEVFTTEKGRGYKLAAN